MSKGNKKKIFNDPIYGFISIKHEIIFDLIEHPFFQRLRRIKQLGMTHLVYPGALHTRFHHAMGAMHLMSKTLEVLQSKGFEISEEEETGALIAILLHDIGHGPFSHALEHTLASGISHEDLSSLFMNELNKEFDGKLTTAIQIFSNNYSRKFLHQLVSSQLDMDRMDYLRRDSFFTGVSEGVISTERITKLFTIKDDELFIEEKGIYSIEKFIIARRLMYWQVYLHKTVVAAENLLIKILERAKELAGQNRELFATPALYSFLYNKFTQEDFSKDPSKMLALFAQLDDYDIHSAIKVWQDHEDMALSTLCKMLIERKIYKIRIQKDPFSDSEISEFQKQLPQKIKDNPAISHYFLFSKSISNNAYISSKNGINILMNDGTTLDISTAADTLNITALSSPVTKHFVCYAV